MLKFIKKKRIIRVVLNALGLLGFIGTNCLWYLDMSDGWSLPGRIAFAIFRPLLSMTGFILILLPLLLSKSKLLRFFFKMKSLQVISQLSFGVYLWFPLICLSSYYSEQHMIQVGYLDMLYYSSGSFLIALGISYLGFILIEAPMH